MKTFTSPTQKIGELGEDIACKWLEKRGFSITDRNYTKKWGEIDIVALKGGVTHFVEVKSSKLYKGFGGQAKSNYNPAENMHPWKIKRFVRAVETYLLSSKGQKIQNWQIDLLAVYVDFDQKIARCEMFEKIV